MKKKKEIIRGHYFALPRELFMLDLCDREIAIYAYLMSIENRKTYQAMASYATIGKALKLSENTVRKYVLQLEEKELIYIEHTKVKTKDGRTHNGCLLYTIRPIQEAIEHYRYRQYSLFEAAAQEQKTMQRIEEYNRRHPQEPLCAIFSDEVG